MPSRRNWAEYIYHFILSLHVQRYKEKVLLGREGDFGKGVTLWPWEVGVAPQFPLGDWDAVTTVCAAPCSYPAHPPLGEIHAILQQLAPPPTQVEHARAYPYQLFLGETSNFGRDWKSHCIKLQFRWFSYWSDLWYVHILVPYKRSLLPSFRRFKASVWLANKRKLIF